MPGTSFPTAGLPSSSDDSNGAQSLAVGGDVTRSTAGRATFNAPRGLYYGAEGGPINNGSEETIADETTNDIDHDHDHHRDDDGDDDDEEEETDATKITPLPKLQLFITIFIQIAEPVTCTVIYPFVNDLIREIGVTGGDERKTGYYVGVVESIFYAAEALTVLHWGKASDMVGRKPILLGGMAGLAVSMFGFGLSKQYWMLLLSRFTQGAFNGNIGVTKSIMAEITDTTNAPQAFASLPVAWSFGSTIGPAIGGVFSNSADQWPAVFGSFEFFKTYPYFLPCFIASLMPLLALTIGLIGLKETNPVILRRRQRQALKDADLAAAAGQNEASLPRPESSSLFYPHADYGSATTSKASTLAPSLNSRSPSSTLPYTPSSATDSLKKVHDDYEDEFPAPKPSFRSIFIPQVLIPIMNFMFFAFLDQCLLVLIPLAYSTPVEYGGLDLSPSQIGVILGVFGILNGLVQVFCFAWVRKMIGHRATYKLGLFGLGVAFAMFPVLERLKRMEAVRDIGAVGGRIGLMVSVGIVVQLACYSLSFMSYACLFLYVGASAPSRASLGTTNGLAQLSASSVRALAPTTASSLFSFSLSLRNPSRGMGGNLGGYVVYIFLIAITSCALVWSRWLPKGLKKRKD